MRIICTALSLALLINFGCAEPTPKNQFEVVVEGITVESLEPDQPVRVTELPDLLDGWTGEFNIGAPNNSKLSPAFSDPSLDDLLPEQPEAECTSWVVDEQGREHCNTRVED